MNDQSLDQALIDALAVEGVELSVDAGPSSLRPGTSPVSSAAASETSLPPVERRRHYRLLPKPWPAQPGRPVSEVSHQQSLDLLTVMGSVFTSSLYRDLRNGEPVEVEHMLGGLAPMAWLLGVSTPPLDATLVQLRTHQCRGRRSSGDLRARQMPVNTSPRSFM